MRIEPSWEAIEQDIREYDLAREMGRPFCGQYVRERRYHQTTAGKKPVFVVQKPGQMDSKTTYGKSCSIGILRNQ